MANAVQRNAEKVEIGRTALRSVAALLGVAGIVVGVLSGCTEDKPGVAGSGIGGTSGLRGPGKVGVVLPDTTSSQRWERQDARHLQSAFAAAGVPVDIENAHGDRARFVKIAEDMISEGARVLIIANLDSSSGKAALDLARAASVKTIDYDRLTLNGGADYYVSFDNRKVGELQARVLKDCLGEKGYRNPVIAELNGSETDNNASLFKEGYDAVLQPMYDAALYTKGPDQWVPGWREMDAVAIFDQMLSQQPRIQGVLAANDGIANAVIGVLKRKGRGGKVPVTGQDATVRGLQNVLAGDQCMTVFKDPKAQAELAAKLAITLYNGRAPDVEKVIKDPESGIYLPFVRLTPRAITKADVKQLIAADSVDRAEICVPDLAQECERAGI
ncbi:substrate-binding domain-containing protein [Actinoplanes sp. NBRC 103695]|uniref:sugar ABC transporter substrate-binding protein n=1 Tax=Actinoplanes sp. NBRC 103695 TaxID=3032202 RepID=UPI0024A27950|nr:substrate-binding domain-containing protein [Actinoplanes sp. NBRC 103695]GLZ01780.1 sugar ABC transporter substrate-binding protein [Actinoplanes sp. NBRC 103695]